MEAICQPNASQAEGLAPLRPVGGEVGGGEHSAVAARRRLDRLGGRSGRDPLAGPSRHSGRASPPGWAGASRGRWAAAGRPDTRSPRSPGSGGGSCASPRRRGGRGGGGRPGSPPRPAGGPGPRPAPRGAGRACGGAPRGRRASRGRPRRAGPTTEAPWTGFPFSSRYMSRRAAAGAISRKSRASTWSPDLDDGEAAAAQVARFRIGHGQGERRGHRGVDRVAAARRISSPASVARASPEETAPPVPIGAGVEAACSSGRQQEGCGQSEGEGVRMA